MTDKNPSVVKLLIVNRLAFCGRCSACSATLQISIRAPYMTLNEAKGSKHCSMLITLDRF